MINWRLSMDELKWQLVDYSLNELTKGIKLTADENETLYKHIASWLDDFFIDGHNGLMIFIDHCKYKMMNSPDKTIQKIVRLFKVQQKLCEIDQDFQSLS